MRSIWILLVALACAAETGGCSCSASSIEGHADTYTEISMDAEDDGILAVCGNGVVDDGEECDDGDSDRCNGCDNECRWMRALQVNDALPGAFVEAGGYPCLPCPYTVEAWFRLDAEDNAVTLYGMLPFASLVGGNSEHQDLVFLRDLWGGGSMDPGNPDIGLPIDPGTWHHHAVSCWVGSGVRHIAYYFDGMQWASGAIDPVLPTLPICTGAMIILDEQREIPPDPYPLNAATIDDLRISNEGLYTSSFTPERHLEVRPDTVALWQFDQVTDGIIHDVTGNRYNAVLLNGVFVSDDCHLP